MPGKRKRYTPPYDVYRYTPQQIEQFYMVLDVHCTLHYFLGDATLGQCLKTENMVDKVSRDKWSDFAEYPRRDVKAYVLVFIVTRGYFPIDLRKHGLCISHPCGSKHSNCITPLDIRVETIKVNVERYHCHKKLMKERNKECFLKSKKRRKILKCKKHKSHKHGACFVRTEEKFIKVGFNMIAWMKSFKIPKDYDDL